MRGEMSPTRDVMQPPLQSLGNLSVCKPKKRLKRTHFMCLSRCIKRCLWRCVARWRRGGERECDVTQPPPHSSSGSSVSAHTRQMLSTHDVTSTLPTLPLESLNTTYKKTRYSIVTEGSLPEVIKQIATLAPAQLYSPTYCLSFYRIVKDLWIEKKSRLTIRVRTYVDTIKE